MEEEPVAIAEDRAFTRQHANGEIFSANSVEQAQRVCPVLGNMSLEEAGLLLELEAIGKDLLEDNPEDTAKPPVADKVITKNITKIEKVSTPVTATPFIIESSTTQLVIPPTAETIEVPSLGIHEMLLQQEQITRQTRVVEESISTTAVEPNKELALPLIDDAVRSSPVSEISTKPIVATAKPEIASLPINDGVTNEATFTVPELPVDLIPEPVVQLQPEDREIPDIQESVPAIVTAPESEEPELSFETIFELESPDFTQPDIENVADVVELLFEPAMDEPGIDVGPLLHADEQELAEQFTLSPLEAVAIPELPAPFTEVEDTIMQLAEVLEDDETPVVRVILERIIALPTKINALENMSEVEIEETLTRNLEILFTELFTEIGIEPTPELIESFVILTRSHYLESLLPVAYESTKAEELPKELGTREFLQKLHDGIIRLKQVAANFYEIGRSILHLYTVSHSQLQAIS